MILLPMSVNTAVMQWPAALFGVAGKPGVVVPDGLPAHGAGAVVGGVAAQPPHADAVVEITDGI